MKKFILLSGLLLCFVAVNAQKTIELSDISMINLGDGRLYATSYDKKKKPIDGKVRIITGYTTEYVNAEFDKGYATGKWEYYKYNVLQSVRHYSEGLLHGETVEYYNDGKTVKSHVVMKNGKPDGVIAEYSQDGKKTYEKQMKNGVEDGYERRYADDGTVVSETFYKDGKQEGKSFSITNKGGSSEKQTVSNMKDGKQEGEYLVTYADGSVKTKGAYKNGRKEGLWESFKPDGKHDGPSEEYVDDKVVKRIRYYTDNSPESETYYNAEGKKHGVERAWAFDGGHLTREQNYVNGVLKGKQMRRVSSNHGAYLEHSVYDEESRKDGEYSEIWEETGNIKAKGQYAKDKKAGKWLYGEPEGRTPPMEEVYENGIRRSKKIFVESVSGGNYFESYNYNERGQNDGEYTEIWEEGGKIKTRGLYEKNRKQGVWTTYDQQGKLLTEAVYKDGSEVSKKE
jgi:antitoxin component YwqK of YwqJK toxin-antitoxin module